jgi:outer membrane protein assembly factor BamD (BamD/ComL family)
MFFKQICIVFVVLGILGYIFGDHVFLMQAHFMLNQQYPIPAYEAYERLIKYYPNSKYVKEARSEMDRLRKATPELDQMLSKNEANYQKQQKAREKTESFR